MNKKVNIQVDASKEVWNSGASLEMDSAMMSATIRISLKEKNF